MGQLVLHCQSAIVRSVLHQKAHSLKKRRLLISFVPIYTSASSGIVSHAVFEMSLGRLFLQSSFYFETRFLPAHFRLEFVKTD